jgi:uncharacterized protein YyaL (SSP411 family)
MNRLGQEKSPYLLQHKDNPINWFAWGPEAFAKAAQENKPVFLSIGYSTCHWCHVMAHESFEDAEVAEALNKSFVCIKLDREERPDVDDIYMAAVQTLTGGGGWPLSAWLTAEGKPFFAGTYFPKYRFLQLLRRIEQIWTTEGDKLEQDATRLTTAVTQASALTASDSAEADYEDFLKGYITHFQHHYDAVNGGFSSAPKFPQTMNLMVMMRQDRETQLNQAEAMVTHTLQSMLRGGIYDHLEGGFHRYSVDEMWLVPHFEKMLYDQAMISLALLEAYQSYGGDELLRAARETLGYVLRELRDPQGGFYCAQDADSKSDSGEMEEGFFCTYTFAELSELLDEDELALLQSAYGVSRNGNFEGRNILSLQEGYDGEVLNEPDIQSAFKKLRKLRASRPQPHLDDKVVTGWNGWMIWALCKGYQVTGDKKYLTAAQKAAHFVRENLWKHGKLLRRWRDGEAAVAAVAEDYTSMINACVQLYESDFSGEWSAWALELQAQLDATFWDEAEGGYYSSDGKDKLLVLRTKEDYDGIRPCSNSLGALNLLKMFHWTGEVRYRQRADGIFQLLFEKLKTYPSSLPFLAVALDFLVHPEYEAVLAGGGTWLGEFKETLQRRFHPNMLWVKAATPGMLLAEKPADRDAIYLCEEGRCLKPSEKLEDALAVVSGK